MNRLFSFLLIFCSSILNAYRIHKLVPVSQSSTAQFCKVPAVEGVQTPLLVRAYNGEKVERTPIWMLRQAGRYMTDFRKYSEKLSFRERSETPDIAIELSLQPWKRFGVDGVIMFSDILTPLPAMGIDFSMVEGKGPKILKPLRAIEDIDSIKTIENVEIEVPFLGPILKGLRNEIDDKIALIGFIGAPWTLAAYAVEGGHSKLCKHMKTLCYENPLLLHQLLQRFTNSLCHYASYQIACGAQIIQIFESWAHHLNEELFLQYARPYADQIAMYLKAKHPTVPLVYFSNGGSVFLQHQKEMSYDSLSIDWRIDISTATEIVNNKKVLAGNLDPTILYCNDGIITEKVQSLLHKTKNAKYVCNLGHGIEKDMTEHAIEVLVNCVKSHTKNS